MIAFCPAKINLGLQILEKRPDNYHNIDSYFIPVPLFDLLEIKRKDKGDADEFVSSGFVSTTTIADNLVFKAISLIRNYFPIPPLQIHLHKQIPVQAGLGGGSSDAVGTIKLIDALLELKMSKEMLWNLALQLGSDCPFFVDALPARVGGRGEIINTVSNFLKEKFLVIIKPFQSVKTQTAFQNIEPINRPLHQIANISFNDFQSLLPNHFEAFVAIEIPDILLIKKKLIESGAFMASLTGSGSAVYGLFHFQPKIQFNQGYFVWKGKIQ
jgi:4-diphosphocytidyl-2-C-methyl-D-erythritol kinase